VAAMVLVADRRQEVIKAVRSLYEQDVPGLDVVVVDNDSHDGSAAAVAAEFPEARVIRLPYNTGVCLGRNIAFENTTAPLVFQLDDDAVAPPGVLRRLIEEMEADPRLAIAVPRIVRVEPGAEPPTRGSRGGPVKRYVGSFTGCAVLVRRAAIDAVGYLWREDFFREREEPELLWRLLDAGYLAARIEDVEVYHYLSARTRNPAQVYYNVRNGIVSAAQYFPPATALAALAWKLATYPVRAAAYGRLRDLAADYRGLAAAAFRGFRDRRPLGGETWRLYRRLRRSEAADLAELEPMLAAGDGRAPASRVREPA